MPIPSDTHVPGDTGHVTDHNAIADVLTALTATAATETSRAETAEAGLMSQLTQAAVLTANYTASANQVVPVNTTAGNVTVTLPTAPASGTVVAVKMVIQGGTNTVTVACGGADVLNKTGGSTSMTLTLLNQGVLLAYGSGIWVNLADDLPLTQLQALFAPLASPAFTGTPTAPTQTTGDASTKLATDAFVSTAVANGSAAGFTGSLAGDVTGTQSATAVGKIQGVAVTAAEAALVSDLNNATTRTATATLLPGEETVFTGSTAAQTLTLPASPPSSSVNTVTNAATVAVSLAPGAGSTLSSYGTSGTITVPSGYTFAVVYIGTTWYVQNAGPSDFARNGALSLTNGGTGQTTAAAALSALGGAAVAGDIGGTSAAPQAVSTHLTVATNATATGTVNLDPTSTRVFAVTQTGNCTFTFTSGSSYATGVAYSFTLYLSQDATGGRTSTWPGSVTWVGGVVPTLVTTTGALNVLVFETVNAGTTWYGSLVTAPSFPLTVPTGGTGLATLGAYQVLTGGTTSTGAVQSVSGTGTSGYVLTSNGASTLPTWQVATGGGGGSGTNAGVFGDGSDTSATLDGTATVTWASKASSVYTMTRDAMLSSLTVNSGVTLNTANFRIFCTGTVANAGTIASNGNNAVSSSAAAAQATGSLIGNGGGAGATGAGATGGASGTRWGVGTGSAGGLGSAGAAGAAGGAQKTGITPHHTPTAVLSGYSSWAGTGYPVSGAAGGGGGGGDGTNSGGGGGAGGGILAILAHTITNTGTLAANGGNGFTPTTGNCGGGGGGGGGLVLGYTLAAWTAGTTSVTGGTQGSGVGTGAAGTAGTAGTVLNVVIV